MKPSSSYQVIYPIYTGIKSLSLYQLSSQEFTQSTQLCSILLQLTKIFLRKSSLTPSQCISQYLLQSNRGQHVLLKSFSSFNKCTMNRICFLYSFGKIFQIQNHQRNGLDYYQLFRLLCSDFPKDIVNRTVNLLNQFPDNDLTKILNSRKFINALYLNFIHTDYLDSMWCQVFQSKSQQVPITLLAEWVYQKQKNVYKMHQKPLFSSVIQSLLNSIRKKHNLNQMTTHNSFPSTKQLQNKTIHFINEKTCLSYIQQQCGFKDQSNDKKNPNFMNIGYQQFLKEIINQLDYHKWIKENLEMFDNSIIWAVQTYKILSAKEQTQEKIPINQKKIKKK